MNMKPIMITEKDYQRLNHLVKVLQIAKGPKIVAALRNELVDAVVVPPEEIPQDVITMNSRIRLKKRKSASEMEISVVFPEDTDIVNRKISVLAPVGTAVLGCKVGDEVKWPSAQGAVVFQVEEIVYQPEAAGDLHL
jgi:regulator of nucleoside diphosphate kinase